MDARELALLSELAKMMQELSDEGVNAEDVLLGTRTALLEKKKATTHWGAHKLLKKISPSTKVIKKNKYVFDKYYTSAGVSTGIDMSLYIIENVYGKTIAKNTAKYIEYKY